MIAEATGEWSIIFTKHDEQLHKESFGYNYFVFLQNTSRQIIQAEVINIIMV